MRKFGLTGGYATGKSLVAHELEKHGCHLIYADRLGRQVMERDGEAYAGIVELFGTGILNTDGAIDRKRLATIVFASPERLEQLNALVHPAVFVLENRALAAAEASDPGGIAIVEAAILIETGRYKLYEGLIVTTCPQETQIARAIHRDGITREEALARIARQLPDSERLRHASWTIHTEGTKAETQVQIEALFKTWTSADIDTEME
jgi:dephospho-CoA kinase